MKGTFFSFLLLKNARGNAYKQNRYVKGVNMKIKLILIKINLIPFVEF